MAGRALRATRHLALTWALDIDHGGMTTAMLRRSRMFAQASGSTVDVLTFDDDHDYGVVEAELRSRGEFADDVRVLNLWAWLEGVARRSAARTTTRFAADGTTALQVDHLRADGSILVSDRRDNDRRGRLGGRRVTLHDESGHVVREWASIWGLYRYWLDALVGDSRAVVIADSKPMAAFLATYRRRNTLTAHVIHGSHRDEASRSLRASRRAALERLDQFDLVVTLTEQQRRDVEEELGGGVPLVTIPNAIDLPPYPEGDRSATRGIMIGALIGRKRVSHAIAAVARVEGVTLDVYGDGPERRDLAESAPASVRFHGHVPGAAAHLAEASFLLLTSRSEGSPLVIGEAMAAGCIPVAYDIAYGPSDLITDGVNGFLAPSGDIAGLAQRIETLIHAESAELERMRAAGRATVEAFGEEQVLARWEEELASAWWRKRGLAPRAQRYLARRLAAVGWGTPRPGPTRLA